MKSLVLAAAAVVFSATSSYAGPLVQNGSFETGGNGLAFVSGSYSGASVNQAPSQIANWTAFGGGTLGVTQYNGFTVNSANILAADNLGVSLPCTVQAVSCVSGYTLQPGGLQNDPDGGYFVEMDGDPNISTGVKQTITGLSIGDKYTVSFDWAAADRQQNTGAFTAGVVVGFGTDSASTTIFSEPSHGFSGWFTTSFTFTAAATSEVLSFLAVGTPAGNPPGILLDGVALTDIPEPTTLSMMLGTVILLSAARRRRRSIGAN